MHHLDAQMQERGRGLKVRALRLRGPWELGFWACRYRPPRPGLSRRICTGRLGQSFLRIQGLMVAGEKVEGRFEGCGLRGLGFSVPDPRSGW